ncbi:MAG: 16S rRNA (cytosine(1402)-N(4))-methyltransferase RsmH [Patescibacteria group bacterium]
MHTPVLLKEIIEVLNPQSGEFFIDGTLGSGGHAIEILKKIMPDGKLLGVDLDKDNLEKAKLNISAELKINSSELKNNLILVHGNYASLPEILGSLKNEKFKNLKADGLLIDLGFSSEQLVSGRGFSFLKDEPLDMRYNTERTLNECGTNAETAAEIVNSYSEKDLADIFYKYGEERFSRRIAKNIVEARRKKRILTTFDLASAIKKATSIGYEKGRIHPATRVFQALRIYVNDELGNLEKLLKNLDKIFPPEANQPLAEKSKGRIAIIAFHSLEDRLVKNYFREMAKDGRAEILTKKPITATLEEIRKNPRSRSAKMRAILLNN